MSKADRLNKAIEYLQAARDGKQLQRLDITGTEYRDLNVDSFIGKIEEVRIKPEPVLRPWTEAEIEAECIKGTVLKYMDSIGPISKLGCDIRVGAQYIGEMSKAVTMLMKYGKVAATGAPCGVYE